THARGVDAEDLADAPVGDELAELADRRVEALDVADHELDAGAAGGGRHAQAVLQRGGDRLLDQQVLAGGDDLHRDARVLLGGRGDADRVDVAALDQLAVVAEVGDGTAADALARDGLVGLGHADDLRALDALPRLEVVGPHPAQADDPDGQVPHAASFSSLLASSTTSCAMRCAARPSPKMFGRSCGRGCSSAFANASGSTPTSTFQPAATVSTHSVSSRRVMQGTPQR